jgi:hypothetical protein
MEDVTEIRDRAESSIEQRSGRAWLLLWPLAALVVAAGLVLVSPLMGHATVNDESAQRDLGFGMPLTWVHQDQSALDPPFPWQARFGSPTEAPTTASAALFAAAVVIVFVVMVATLALVLLVLRQVRTSRRT